MRRSRPEQAIQRAIFQHLAWRSASGVGLGVRAGVPDVIAIHRGEVFALELKTEHGKATSAQLQAIEDIRRAGGHAEICRGIDHALVQLETWGLLRGRVQ
jgi:hypothetical protein